ncbi:MAG: hypothetical protein QOE86_3238 [Solirubrobacteraceae bacterium]|nr:hypothetical protein [Solirubrobacteraceae bacterium]
MEFNAAPTLRLELTDDDELLGVEYDLPHVEEHLDEQADAFRERYDEEILAALIAPSF